MPGTDRPVLTDKQLRDAMEKADMPPRDYRIFGALVFRADWASGVIPKQFQPRSLRVLAKATGMSTASVAEGLNHLERHGWVVRARQGPGRGNSTVYGLAIGGDCDCAEVSKVNEVSRPAPKTDAERARDYRERQKASRIQRDGASASREIRVTKRPASRDESAGQAMVSADKGSVTRGVEEEAFGEPLTVTIAGTKFPAEPCRTCGEPVADILECDGVHPSCAAPKEERMGA